MADDIKKDIQKIAQDYLDKHAEKASSYFFFQHTNHPVAKSILACIITTPLEINQIQSEKTLWTNVIKELAYLQLSSCYNRIPPFVFRSTLLNKLIALLEKRVTKITGEPHTISLFHPGESIVPRSLKTILADMQESVTKMSCEKNIIRGSSVVPLE